MRSFGRVRGDTFPFLLNYYLNEYRTFELFARPVINRFALNIQTAFGV